MMRRSLGLALAVLLVAAGPALARRGTEPISFTQTVLDLGQVAHRQAPPADVAALLHADALKAGALGAPYRVAQPIPLGLALKDSATWEVLDRGDQLWRLRVSSAGALFLSFELTSFELPYGAELRFFSVDRDYYDGPYTLRHNNAQRTFHSPIIPGDSAVIELLVPAAAALSATFTPEIVVKSVSYGYKDFAGAGRVPFRDGGKPLPARGDVAKVLACEVDVNCPEGADWQDDKRAVAETFDGTFICSGAMLNNVRGDCRNLFLTANHCVKSSGKAANLVLYWNYENSGCNTGDAPIDQTTVGTTLLATYGKSDFTLLELNNPPPASYFVYHAGWNRSNTPPSSGVTIHHPDDAPRKISFEFDPIEDGGNHSGGWGDDHWRVVGWDIGTTEGGSSGSGLWNPNHQIIGQLHGGTGDCDGGWDEFGKIFTSWTHGLSQHLDPDGTGAMSVDGMDCGSEPPPPEPCELGQVGDPCTVDADCCSNKCRGPSGGKTCKG